MVASKDWRVLLERKVGKKVAAKLAADWPAALATLPERERRIFVARIGSDGRPPRTLGDIGREHGVTGARIRELEARAAYALERYARGDPVFRFGLSGRLTNALTRAGVDDLDELRRLADAGGKVRSIGRIGWAEIRAALGRLDAEGEG